MEDPLKEAFSNPPRPNIRVQKERLHLSVRKFLSVFKASQLTRNMFVIILPLKIRHLGNGDQAAAFI